jgi:hypothetical protein
MALFRSFKRLATFGRSPEPKVVVRRIPLTKLLLGGEWNWRAKRYAYATGELIRLSIPVSDGPHAEFLRQYAICGRRIFEKPIFSETAYFRNARDSIRLFGEYFPYCWLPEHIEICAKRFVLQYEHKSVTDLPSVGHSPTGENIRVFTVKDSDCYELDEGNHRVAFAALRGDESILADILDIPDYTPLQEMILRVEWQSGEREIYQPLGLPEIQQTWRLLRKSSDRLERMLRFLDMHNLTPERAGKVLDVGAYYGWFVSEFLKRGYDAYGVERDRTAICVGDIVYGNVGKRIQWDDAGIALRESTERYGVICCLSIIHHYILRKNSGISTMELLNLLDERTEKVLFLEMGEEHEAWFSRSLAGWNIDTIKKWVLGNSKFKNAYELGRDADNVGLYRGNFGRMLIAFTK